MPIVVTIAAALIAAIVSARIRRGVSHEKPRVCNHVRKPVAAEVAAIAQPMHMRAAYLSPRPAESPHMCGAASLGCPPLVAAVCGRISLALTTQLRMSV
jgi:hypothetical protein